MKKCLLKILSSCLFPGILLATVASGVLVEGKILVPGFLDLKVSVRLQQVSVLVVLLSVQAVALMRVLRHSKKKK